MSLVGWPWLLKPLWAPFVDLYGSRQQWILACQFFLGLLVPVVTIFSTGSIGTGLWMWMTCLALLSATQDIAVDAYTIELLAPHEMGRANGIRVTTYRIALIATGGIFLMVADRIGWHGAFIASAIALIALALLSFFIPKTLRPVAQTGGALETGPLVTATRSLAGLVKRPGFIFIALFILFYKLGDMAMGPMVKPFWVDRKFTPMQIGLVPGTVGVVSTIVGALWGGAFTSRYGIFKGLWVLGAAQAISNLFYAAAASLPPSLPMMYTASVVESLTGGLGTAAFLSFLMSLCDKQYAATQYALLSALFGFTRSISGAFSGYATEHFGYTTYFVITFFLAWPAYLLLPWVRRWTVPGRVED